MNKKNLRLCDLFLQSPVVSEDFKGALKEVVVIDGTNVSDFYYTDPQEMWTFQDFPCPLPPFSHCWLEFKAPEVVISEKNGVIPWNQMDEGNAPSHWGFLCDTHKLSSEERLAYIQGLKLWKNYPAMYAPYLEQIGWHVELILYFYKGEKQSEYPYWFFSTFLDENGDMIMKDEKNALSVSITMDQDVLNYLGFIEETQGTEVMEDFKRHLYNGVCPFWHTALLSFSFMNCKNIQFVDVKPEKVVPHTKAQKRRGEKAFQPVSYKVLNLSPIKKVLADEGQELVGTKEALARAKKKGHFVRGHFANYTEENKLFGKYTGRYYRAMHRRGDDATGQIDKGYKLGKPDERPGK